MLQIIDNLFISIMERVEIEVECPGKPEMHFQVPHGSLKIADLKRYYETAVGLTYTINSKTYCVDVRDDELKIVPGVHRYTVFCSGGMILYFVITSFIFKT